jgi:predicted ATP-grasp superfamily ATP-dependent carboligase
MATDPADLPLHSLDPQRLPVVLLGGITLVRTLGLAGIQAVVASPNPDDPVFSSRYCAAACVLPRFDQDEAAVDAIVALGDRLSYAYGRRVPLMYGSDDALELIYAHRERLQRHFLLLLNDPEIGNALLAKDRFQALAQSRGLPVPAELSWDGMGPGTLAGAKGPVIIKPRLKADWYGSKLRERLFPGDAKARVFRSGAAVLADPAATLFRDQLTCQEYIPGGEKCLWSFHGLADGQGHVLTSFVGRKLRTYPPVDGESAFIELAHDDSLSDLGRFVAARLPLKGVFKMDFKRDPRDGRWHLLEINARYNLWHYLGACNGLNLMRAAYDFLIDGAQWEPERYDTRRRWLSLGLDFAAYRKMAAKGDITLGAWLRSFLFSRNVYNVFAWRDPAPWIHFQVNRVTRRWDRGYGLLLGMLRQWRSTAS